jgi:hypothetical protein
LLGGVLSWIQGYGTVMVIDSRPAVSVYEDLNSSAEMAMHNLLREL